MIYANRRSPAITIGMMVHNEAEYLERSLASLCRQDEGGFELVIVDNASCDHTPLICERYATVDRRVRYVRNERNVGAIASFSRLINEARGDYFVLAAGHDQWSNNYLRELKHCLDTDPTAVLAFGATEWIDAEDQTLPLRSGILDTSGMHPVGRFLTVLWNNRNCLYGMIRLSDLGRTDYGRPSITMESVIMQQLAIRGTFAHVPEATWRRRIVRPSETADQRLQRYYGAGFLFEKAKIPLLPFWRIPFALAETGLRAPVSWSTRVAMAVCSLTSVVFLRDELMSDVRRLPGRIVAGLRHMLARRRPAEKGPVEKAQSRSTAAGCQHLVDRVQ